MDLEITIDVTEVWVNIILRVLHFTKMQMNKWSTSLFRIMHQGNWQLMVSATKS